MKKLLLIAPLIVASCFVLPMAAEAKIPVQTAIARQGVDGKVQTVAYRPWRGYYRPNYRSYYRPYYRPYYRGYGYGYGYGGYRGYYGPRVGSYYRGGYWY